MRWFLSLCVGVACVLPTLAAPFEFKRDDRVILVGSTLIEREQRYGYWETALTVRYPGIKVRNLGWSGDNVLGEARRAFEVDQVEVGRKRLIEHVLAEKPTVIVVCYGANESYAGEAGRAKFTADLEKLLDAFAPAKARIVLLSPTPLEDKGRPLPDPTAQNQRLALYRDALKEVAGKRQLYFADLFHALGENSTAMKGLTDNGVHLTDGGYKATAKAFLSSLGHAADGAYSDSMDALRQAITVKNELYFHHWRPQNQTYLFGFRKHEQGRNAKEITEFVPLIDDAEKAILQLLNGAK